MFASNDITRIGEGQIRTATIAIRQINADELLTPTDDLLAALTDEHSFTASVP